MYKKNQNRQITLKDFNQCSFLSGNNRFVVTFIGLAIMAGLFVFSICLTTTPMVIFSVSSGFYDEDFYLELKSGWGTKIYYTLDSSDPDENSLEYTEPILVSDASTNENIYSMIEDVTLDFKKDLLQQAGTSASYGYKLPLEPVDKVNVVRAIAIDRFGNKSEIRTEIYGIGFNEKYAYDDMNIISVVTDPANLFDYENGIYVTGKVFDDSLVNGKVMTPITPNFGWWQGNYTQRDAQWEKRAHVTLWDSDRHILLEDEFGLRIQGGSSRGGADKSLNLFVRDYSSSKVINGKDVFSEGFFMGSIEKFWQLY